MNKKTLSALALISALSLVGCANDSSTTQEGVSEAPTASQTPSEPIPTQTITLDEPFYAKTPEGSEIVVDFTREAPADVEEFRTATGAEPVTYAHVTIDNREGSEYSSVYQATLYDEDGNSYPFQDLELYHFSEWGPTMNEDYDEVMPDGSVIDEATASQFNQMEYALNEKYFDDGADVNERSESWMAGPGNLPDEFTGISIEANGSGSGTPMVPLSEKDSYVVPTDGSGPHVVGPPPTE